MGGFFLNALFGGTQVEHYTGIITMGIIYLQAQQAPASHLNHRLTAACQLIFQLHPEITIKIFCLLVDWQAFPKYHKNFRSRYWSIKILLACCLGPNWQSWGGLWLALCPLCWGWPCGWWPSGWWCGRWSSRWSSRWSRRWSSRWSPGRWSPAGASAGAGHCWVWLWHLVIRREGNTDDLWGEGKWFAQ